MLDNGYGGRGPSETIREISADGADSGIRRPGSKGAMDNVVAHVAFTPDALRVSSPYNVTALHSQSSTMTVSSPEIGKQRWFKHLEAQLRPPVDAFRTPLR